MKKCSTVSFEGQVIFVGIDVHKESWVVNLRHCHRELDKESGLITCLPRNQLS